MTDIVDSTHMSQAVAGVRDEQLGALTPCRPLTVAGLLDHIDGMALAFAAAARKQLGPLTATGPQPDAAHLTPAWRQQIPARLEDLAEAWTDPDAWQGMTQVGGITLPGAIAGHVALHEVVLHGWDLARATGQPYKLEDHTVEACLAALVDMYPLDKPDQREGIFGPPVPIAVSAPLLDRAVAYSGRDPHWSSPEGG